LLVERGLPGLGISDFVPTGILIIIAGLLYMALIGRRLLPERESVGQNASPRSLSRSLYETYKLEERLWEVRVLPGSRLVEVPLSRCSIGEELGLTVLAIWRGPQAILTPEPMEVIHSGDYLLMLGREERVAKLSEWGVSIGRENGHVNPRHDYSVDLTEVVIPPRSSAIGKSLSELRFRNKYGLTTVALWREGRSYRTDVGTFPLEVGDALLMVGPASRIKSLAQDRDFLVLQSSHAIRPRNPQKAGWALLILAAVVLASLFRIVPAAEAMLAGAAAMVLTGCLNMDEAYRAVEWRVVFLIAGMLPISIALYQTGLSAAIGGTLVDMLAPYGGLALIAGLVIFTMLIVQVMGGQVTSLIVGPIAVSTALQFGMNPQAIAVAVATACATAFLTPMAHPVNVLMMGPGGYKPGDFTRVGLGMTVVVFVMLLIGMAVFWSVR
jgi:di/tricarboxylate transporter